MLSDGYRFVRGLRAMLRQPVTAEEARRWVADGLAQRDERFLRVLERAVWPSARSPYRMLLANAGFDAGAVAELVRTDGLDQTLAVLRDGGVYVAYEEFLGKVPARRGSASFSFSPSDFHNPTIDPDYLSRSGGSRTAGIGVPLTFGHLRGWSLDSMAGMLAWGARDVPIALWFPALPAGAGINTAFIWAAAGKSLERWFSQVPPNAAGLSVRKRLANSAFPLLTAGTGVHIPRPHLTTSPDAVLAWCRDALTRHGRLYLVTYATSAVALAELAITEDVSLDGMVLATSGEPLTAGRLDRVEATGARCFNVYGSAHFGTLGMACPECDPEEVHAMAHGLVVVPRRRARADGVMVDAFCWTSLAADGALVAINFENDDYGEILQDDTLCTCQLGQLGVRTRLRHVRGMSKVVAGGTTVPGELFAQLVEEALPARFGGAGIHYQFVERGHAGAGQVALRIHPSVGPVDEVALLAVVRDRLRAVEAGRLATDVWAVTGGLVVEREPPVPTASGKVMPFETLPVGSI